MYNLGIVLAIITFGLVNFSRATNYCHSDLCDPGVVHIGCNNDGRFAPICEDPYLVQMTPSLQQAILFAHNDLRNKVATGALPRFQSAQRMTTMTWDDELADLAALNVLQCEMVHDACHNTFPFRYSGQNLAIQFHSRDIDPASDKGNFVFMINDWFKEYIHADQSDMDMCSDSSQSKGIGHFTAMMQEKSSKVGCAAAKFKGFNNRLNDGIKYHILLLACNYSFTNMVDLPIYVKGPQCSACKTGCNPQLNGLCSVNEKVAPSPYKYEEPENECSLPRPSAYSHQSQSLRFVEPTNGQLNVPGQTNIGVPTKRVRSKHMMELMAKVEKDVHPFDVSQVPGHFCPKNPPPRTTERPSTKCVRQVPTDFKYVPGQYKRTPDIREAQLAVPVRRDASGRPLRNTPSGRLQKLIDTAAPVVRPFDPVRDNPDNFYFPYIPNPEVGMRIVRPVPVVTWRGKPVSAGVPIATAPAIATSHTTAPAIAISPVRAFATATATNADSIPEIEYEYYLVETIPWPFTRFTRI